MEENTLYDRIGEADLNPTYKDGQVLQHIDMNNIVGVTKEGINANYHDIQKIENGEKIVGNAVQLNGAALSRYLDESLQADDNKVPSSQQVKNYVEGLFSDFSAPVKGVDYWTESDKAEIIDDTVTAVKEDIEEDYYDKSDIDTKLLGKLDIDDIVDNLNSSSSDKVLSAKQGGILKDLIGTKLSESDLQMVETSNVENGSQITDGTGYAKLNIISGNTLQNGTPTPNNPINIDVVTGDIDITISNSDNTSSQSFELSIGDTELCKIPNTDYKDYIYKENDKWYLHKVIGKYKFNSTIVFAVNDNASSESGQSKNGTFAVTLSNSSNDISNNAMLFTMGKYEYNSAIAGNLNAQNNLNDNTFCMRQGTNDRIYFKCSAFTGMTGSEISSEINNQELYFVLKNPQNIEITDTNLINQLNSIYNFSLYQDESNFTISSDGITPILNIVYAMTNRDIYSKEEINDLFDGVKKDMKDIMKFHIVAKSQATYVAEFPNGKKLLVDTGMPESWNDSKTAIDNLGITKFDYFIITHAHYDHISNIQNFLNNYDFSNCICWVGMKPDYINHSDVILDSESTYDDMITLFQNNGINPIVPTNDSYYTIDKDTKLHFLNTDTTIAENYYSANIIPEYQSTPGVNFNQFSLIIELMYKKDVITLTGDIERINEQYYYPYMHKASLLSLPHHGINRDYYNQFYYAIMPEFAYASWVATSASWIRKDTKEFNFVKELGIKLLSSYNSIPVNGLHTFISNGYTLKSLSFSSGINDPSIEQGKLYSDFVQLMNYTVKLPSSTTIADIFNNMNDGDSLFTNWLSTFATDYLAIYNQLLTIFPNFDNITTKLNLEFRKTRSDVKEIKAYNDRITYIAQSRGTGIEWSLVSGNGIINEDITGIDNLIDRLKNLPFGHYTLKNYHDDIGDVLYTTGNYILSIDLCEKWVSNDENVIVASLYGVHRSDQSSGDKARCFIGFINTSSTPQYVFRKVD